VGVWEDIDMAFVMKERILVTEFGGFRIWVESFITLSSKGLEDFLCIFCHAYSKYVSGRIAVQPRLQENMFSS
jgi:hypothetical protein